MARPRETDDSASEPATPAGEGATPTEADSHSVLADVASTISQPVRSAARHTLQGVDNLTSGARRMFGERSGARVRRVRRLGRQPLSNLWELHPEARRAAIRELGIVTVPVHEIAGTAVEGGAQRGGDFLPLRDRRSDDWRARWQRLLKAVEGMAMLPPIELIKFGDRYWVVDGHNRVAAALYTGQIELDAEVEELRLPGMARNDAPANIASVLEGSRDLRQAGAGRLTKTSVRPDRVPPHVQHAHEHGSPGRRAGQAEAGEALPADGDETG